MQYQKIYRAPINPERNCRMTLGQLFIALQDIIRHEIDPNTNMMKVWPKLPYEIKRDAVKYADKNQYKIDNPLQ